ncbi:MAG: cupin domain-containing protein [Gemmatimonadaceae bacterium]|nr:cupin domain-containing protein [Gemmatimonadaceae bacterium]
MTRRRENAEHYAWGDGCDGWHLVRTDSLSVIEERMPPGTHEVRHRHVRALQFFRVLDGALTLEVDGETQLLRAGEGLEVPPGTPHQAFNRSGADVTFLVVSAPPSHGDRELVP